MRPGLDKRLMALCAAAALCFCAAVRAACAAPVPFAGGKVTIAINSAAGGGYDAYARLVARHLGAFLPGNPTMLPENMGGGGGLIAANWLYNAAPHDGSAIGILASSAIFAPFLGTKQAKYDPAKFNWLANLETYHGVGVATRDAPVRSAADLTTTRLSVGGGGQGSDITIWPDLIKALIGAKLDIVRGYDGAPSVYLAMERGEVQSIFGVGWTSLKTEKAEWLRDGKIRPLVQISQERIPELADVPTVLELARSEEDRAVLSLFVARQIYYRPFLAPPGVPAPVVEQLRRAFSDMVKDPAFLADASNVHLDVDPTSGTDMTRVIESVLASPPEVVARAKAELGSD